MKKTILFIVGGLIILLIGLAVGLLGANYFITKNKGAFCAPKIKAEISPQQIEDITSLKSGQILFGKVSAKGNDLITLAIQLINPLDPEDKKEISINIPINQADEFVRFKRNSNSPNMDTVKSSLNDLEIGDYVSVKIFQDKKTIYLPTINE